MEVRLDRRDEYKGNYHLVSSRDEDSSHCGGFDVSFFVEEIELQIEEFCGGKIRGL